MSAYVSMSRHIKNAVMQTLSAITYDQAGDGGSQAFQNVIDNNRGAFEGDPNVQVLPGDVTMTRETVGQTDKMVALICRVRLPMEDNDKSQSAAYNQMYDLTDLIIDALLLTDHQGTLTDGSFHVPTNFMDAVRGDWVEYPTNGGIELICDVNVQITYSKNLY